MKKATLREDFLAELFWIYQEAKDRFNNNLGKDVAESLKVYNQLKELLAKVERKNFGGVSEDAG